MVYSTIIIRIIAMRITYKGDYALKAILDLAIHYRDKPDPVSIQHMAGRLDIPIKFLEQVLLELKKGGFVESRRGKVGGYLLSRPPSEISLGHVVRFIVSPVEPIACVEDGYKGCRDIYKCVFREVWQRVSDATMRIVDGVTFSDLLENLNRKDKEQMVYQI